MVSQADRNKPKTAKLRACPFCGWGTPKLEESDNFRFEGWLIVCGGCTAQGPVSYVVPDPPESGDFIWWKNTDSAKKNAIKEWNLRRTPHPKFTSVTPHVIQLEPRDTLPLTA